MPKRKSINNDLQNIHIKLNRFIKCQKLAKHFQPELLHDSDNATLFTPTTSSYVYSLFGVVVSVPLQGKLSYAFTFTVVYLWQ
jgi:hypothetical protein